MNMQIAAAPLSYSSNGALRAVRRFPGISGSSVADYFQDAARGTVWLGRPGFGPQTLAYSVAYSVASVSGVSGNVQFRTQTSKRAWSSAFSPGDEAIIQPRKTGSACPSSTISSHA